MIFLKIAWRNIFRNKRRTIITGIAIGMGLGSLIFTDALMKGMEINIIETVTSSFIGDAQIHAENFRQSQDVEKTIKNSDELVENISGEPIVKHFSKRAVAFGMITSPAEVSAIGLFGIEPDKEKFISEIDDAIKEGAFFESGSPRDIVIGSKLAETLKVDLRDRVVVTVAQAKTGELSQEMFRISGIYSFNVKEMDLGMAFISIDMARKMLNIGSASHEIVIKFTDIDFGSNKTLAFWDKYSKNGNIAEGWPQLMPELSAAFDLTGLSMTILGLILFGIVLVVILNTLFMSVYERMYEFGVMRAIGTRPLNMAKLIIGEAGSLAVISIIIGVVVGAAAILITSYTGIDYRGIEFAGATFQRLLYPVFRINQFIIYPLMIFCFTIIASIYPAIYAARMKEAEAMRKSF